MSDTIFYLKQFRIRNPIRHSLPITPSDRISYPKPFRIKNPIRRGFLKKKNPVGKNFLSETVSDRKSYPDCSTNEKSRPATKNVSLKGEISQYWNFSE